MSEREVTYADIEAAAKARDPQLPSLIGQYMTQGDPPEDRREGADEAERSLGRDAWTRPSFARTGATAGGCARPSTTVNTVATARRRSRSCAEWQRSWP
jgi:hypothetical protein